ncbi:MAG TPA: DUF2079 domain-containing protein [Candidatus Eisenbacteria bacterium]|nr:DUF2079 domain-containing protein [Candidatus Eisenbacteria bacterium]
MPLPALALSGAVVLAFSGYAFARWATLQSSALDLAYFDQVVWNAAQGHGFVSSFAPYPFFGQHFSPALGLLVPFYWIHPSPLWLLAAQSLALGAAVVPLYVLARTWLDHRSSMVVCVAYAAQLFVLRAVNYDFHTEALAVPFVFLAVLGAARASRTGDSVLLLSGVAPLLGKEDGALVSLGIGFLAWAVLRRRAGLVLMALSVVDGVVVTVLVMPAIRDGQPGDLIDRYSYLGSSVAGVLLGLATHPHIALLHVLRPGPLIAVAIMLAGVAFLPLARPLAAIAALPSLMLELLSSHVPQSTLLDQYGLQPGPLLFVAALLGWVRIASRWKVSPARLKFGWLTPGRGPGAALLAGALVALVVAAPQPTLGSWSKGQAAQKLATEVPPDASVDASDHLATMLAERESIGVLPSSGRDWIAVDVSAEGADQVAGLPGRGYVFVGRWGVLSLWRRQA